MSEVEADGTEAHPSQTEQVLNSTITPESSPRVEKPILVTTQPTPLSADHNGENTFFPPINEAAGSPSNLPRPPSPTLSVTSNSSSSSRLRDAILAARRISQIDLGTSSRPSVHRDLSHASAISVESNDSTVTITPNSPQLNRSTGVHGPIHFPDQTFAALQYQQHPPLHIPPSLRTGGIYRPEAAPRGVTSISTHTGGIRTEDASPAITPGLFDPHPFRSIAGTPVLEASSPFLHHLHHQAPKETFIADVDVDPISGRKIVNDYEIITELGRGTHGKVKLGRSMSTGTWVAIKIVERFPKKRKTRLGRTGPVEDKIKKEVAILKKCRHTNIVALLEIIDDPQRRKVYLVLERVERGEIPWRICDNKAITMVEARRFERESRGIFNDATADALDEAIIDLGRVRRVNQAKQKAKELRRARRTDDRVWSFEMAGDDDDDGSSISTSRSSSIASVDRLPELDRMLAGSSEQLQRSESSDLLATITPAKASEIEHAQQQESDRLRDALMGTMYGAFDDPLSPPEEVPEEPAPQFFPGLEVHQPLPEPLVSEEEARRMSDKLISGPFLAEACEILESDMHPDLQFVPTMTLQIARQVFRDVLLGMQYLHFQGIIHRDIKPPNLLLTEDFRTKISDFGVSYIGRATGELNEDVDDSSEIEQPDYDALKELARNVGTAAFYAPELCYMDTGNGEHPPVTKAIDIWALGITLYCMVYGRVPFIDGEFVVMRKIAEEEIYFPTRRLRPTNYMREFDVVHEGRRWNTPKDYRLLGHLEYEDVPPQLIALMRRLLDKNPVTRIELDEVRFDEWLTGDLRDKSEWVKISASAGDAATGPKIEISKEDIDSTVVPLTFGDRLRSMAGSIKKAVGSVGLGRSSSAKRRNASQEGSNASASSSTTSVQQANLGRRASVRPDEPILQALKASRDSEHPASKSLAVSPLVTPHAQRVAQTTSLGTPRNDRAAVLLPPFSKNPNALTSLLSTGGSTNTVKPFDSNVEGYFDRSPPRSPTVPESNDNSMAGLLASKLLKTVRDRSRSRGQEDLVSAPTSYPSSEVGDTHGDPSVAMSTASASGQMEQPDALKDFTPASSKPVSPTLSRNSSITGTPEVLQRARFEDFKKMQKSPMPILTARSPTIISEGQQMSRPRSESRLAYESTEEDFDRAETELLRRQIAEDLRKQSVASPTIAEALDEQEDCPPSPDDATDQRRRKSSKFAPGKASLDSIPPSLAPSLDTGMASPTSSVMPLMTPVSSEDHIKVQRTPDTSNPSLPLRGISEHDDEHADILAGHGTDTVRRIKSPTAGAIAVPRATIPQLQDDDQGYHADTAVDSDEDDDDSSDEEGGLQMRSRKAAPKPPIRSASISNAQLARERARAAAASSGVKRSSRLVSPEITASRRRASRESDNDDD